VGQVPDLPAFQRNNGKVEYSPLMKSTILLFASDPLVRSVLKETLEHEGYTVIAVGELGSAVDRMEEYTPDLLIIRGYVEGLPGHDAAVYLRTKHFMKVLVVGGLLDDDRLQLRESLAGFEVFPKPYGAAELLEKVKQVLATPRG
jgi:DNA-binding response OmpR family regulator